MVFQLQYIFMKIRLYPWSPEDGDILNKRDNHYGFINYALHYQWIKFLIYFSYEKFLNDLKPFLKNFQIIMR